MIMSDETVHWAGRILALHAQTPLHPGSGTALGTVDLPIQRERHNRWPTIPGSALKGILRDVCRDFLSQQSDLLDRDRWDDKSDANAESRALLRSGKGNEKVSKKTLANATMDLNALFGPPTEGAGEFAGALSVTDARLLAFPVRSAKGVFAWVSCYAALERLQRDIRLAGHEAAWKINEIGDGRCACAADSPCLGAGEVALLEEFDFKRDGQIDIADVAQWISAHLLRSEFTAMTARFPRHFLVLPDDDFTHFVRHATEVTARIALDYDTKTVKQGALFYQEFLPAESLLYSVVLANPARNQRQSKSALNVLADLGNWLTRDILQIGGDESTGKGLCAVRLV